MIVTTSSQFRATYAILEKPTEVHAGRRKIGTWYPAGTSPDELMAVRAAIAPPIATEPNTPQGFMPTLSPRERQKRIDAVLRKANK